MVSGCLEARVARLPVLRRDLMRAWCIPHRDMISSNTLPQQLKHVERSVEVDILSLGTLEMGDLSAG